MVSTLRSVCVFCGSRPGTNPAYAKAARDVGAMIARHGWRLVYGAGDVGLMGEVARTAQDNHAVTLGVIPIHLMSRERVMRDLTTFIVTENMHERKKVMFMNCDVIVVLPGGAGSLDEFFEVLTWAQIGLHRKPIFLLNTDNYWQTLISLLDHVIDQGFAETTMRSHYTVVSDVGRLTAGLLAALD